MEYFGVLTTQECVCCLQKITQTLIQTLSAILMFSIFKIVIFHSYIFIIISTVSQLKVLFYIIKSYFLVIRYYFKINDFINQKTNNYNAHIVQYHKKER